MQSTTYEIQDISKANLWTCIFTIIYIPCSAPFLHASIVWAKVGGAYVISLALTLTEKRDKIKIQIAT
jgi:cytochrome c biogenesis protein CcdA